MKNNSTLTNSKTPEQLSKWMDDNLVYEGKYKGYLRTPAQLVKDKKGHCWETSELANFELSSLGYVCRTLYIADKKATSTHSTIIYKDGDSYRWFEWAWYPNAGIHEKTKTIEETIRNICKKFIQQYKNVEDLKLSTPGVLTLTNEKDFISQMKTWDDYKPNMATEHYEPTYIQW